MKKILGGSIFGALFVLLLAGGNDGWVREAWAQAKTVMYKDSQQTVTVSHTYTMPTPIPPLTVTGPSLGIPATGFATDMLGNSTVAALGAGTTAGQVRRLTDGGATGAMVLSDGVTWTCEQAKSEKIAMITCPPYNAKGDGTDDEPEIQAAVNSGLPVWIPPGVFTIAASINITSGGRLYGHREALISMKAATNTPIISLAAGANHVIIEGFTLDGNKDQNPDATSTAVRGVLLATAPGFDIVIRSMNFVDFPAEAIYMKGATNVVISQNRFINDNNRAVRILSPEGTPSKFVMIQNNHMENIGASAIELAGEDSLIQGNVITNTATLITQQAIILGYDDAIPGINTRTQRISVKGNVIKTAHFGCIRVGGGPALIEGNILTNCMGRGILVLTGNPPDPGTGRATNVQAVNNHIEFVIDEASAWRPGIDMGYCDGCAALNNTVLSTTEAASSMIQFTDVVGGRISGNRTVEGATGIRVSSCDRTVIANNQIEKFSVRGIYLDATNAGTLGVSRDVSIVGNQVADADAAGVTVGIDTDDASHVNTIITGNLVTSVSQVDQMITGSNTAYAYGNLTPEIVCSMPGEVEVDPNARKVSCGTINVGAGSGGPPSTITTILPGAKGRIIVLRFTSDVTVSDNATQSLQGDMVGTPGDSLTLASDGLGWIEVSRSVN